VRRFDREACRLDAIEQAAMPEICAPDGWGELGGDLAEICRRQREFRAPSAHE